jgi:single-strand DNA-binding protein
VAKHLLHELHIVAGESRLNKQTNEWEDGERMFLRCTAWEELAASLHRGDPVIARARIYLSEYTSREGEKRTSVEGRVESIGASLDRHTVSVTKAGQDGSPAGGGWAAPSHGSAPQYGSTEGGGYGTDGQQSFGSFDDEQPF